MAITKTKFLEYSRCPRYLALEKIEKDKLNADVSYEEYQKEELKAKIEELSDSMFEVNNDVITSKIDVVNKQLQAMLDYYKIVELEAGKISEKTFKGHSKYALNTKEQESFDFHDEFLKYICYVDIYNESSGNINIIEVKATTSRKYTKLQAGYPKKAKYSIWQKINNIYYLKDQIKDYDLLKEMPFNAYLKQKEKLLNRYEIGRYFYDLAVQRFIIEQEYKETNKEQELANIHYYLGVLNENYIFDGTYENGQPKYLPDLKNNELITFFNADEITFELLPIVKQDAQKIKENIQNPSFKECPLGAYCGFKKQTICKYFKEICGKKIPSKNSSLAYLNSGFGFVKEDGTKIKGLELINQNYLTMLDIPQTWLKNPNHLIQRNCLLTHTEYINKAKISKALSKIEYPIYHLDFETFPCPVPRFKGEWPYIQSPFEFSLHIEKAPGICDKYQDNVVFLAETSLDERLNLLKTLLKYIDSNHGTLFAQNVSFEKGRIKELAKIFPEYQKDLLKIAERGFDLLWLLNNNHDLYKKLGFNEKDCTTINYYHEDLSGSYSIKKTLPVFSNLSYQDLEVKNGTEAIIEYANYDKMSAEERKIKQEALKVYCAQDTWAMVEILNTLRQKIK